VRLIEAAVALVIAGGVINLSTLAQDARRAAVPTSTIFEVNEVFVPDHMQGEDPVVIYDRTIHQDFRGFWIAEVQRRDANDLNFPACPGAGVSDYETTDVIPGDKVTLSWLIGRRCDVAPGRYRIRLSYDITIPGWPLKTLTVFSNTFTVQ
jgi:hypothetical protein